MVFNIASRSKLHLVAVSVPLLADAILARLTNSRNHDRLEFESLCDQEQSRHQAIVCEAHHAANFQRSAARRFMVSLDHSHMRQPHFYAYAHPPSRVAITFARHRTSSLFQRASQEVKHNRCKNQSSCGPLPYIKLNLFTLISFSYMDIQVGSSVQAAPKDGMSCQ